MLCVCVGLKDKIVCTVAKPYFESTVTFASSFCCHVRQSKIKMLHSF